MTKYIYLYINFIFLLFNIYFYIKYEYFKNKNNNYFNFKYSDSFNINYIKKSYFEISSILNSKYGIQITSLEEKKTTAKNIKVCILDIYPAFNSTALLKSLDPKFDFKIDCNSPDYLIYGVDGKKHYSSKYINTIKIALYAENKIPDLDEADYALGHSHLNYLDRYFKYFKYYNSNILDSMIKMRKSVLSSPKRKKFCAAVISNFRLGDFFRLKFINELNKYKNIDQGGSYKNNVGGKVKNKVEFFKSYKFSIAMENSSGDGYNSEKIMQSFLSGTIPIYYGDYMIDEIYNPKSFILIRGEKDMKEKIEYIKKIDNDDELYFSLLRENIINTKKFLNIEKEQAEFFNHIFAQETIKAHRIEK